MGGAEKGVASEVMDQVNLTVSSAICKIDSLVGSYFVRDCFVLIHAFVVW